MYGATTQLKDWAWTNRDSMMMENIFDISTTERRRLGSPFRQLKLETSVPCSHPLSLFLVPFSSTPPL